jgi:hypothetical protein
LTLKVTWNVHEVNLHIRVNWHLNLLEMFMKLIYTLGFIDT